MKQNNICKKYGITYEELKEGVDQIGKLSFGKFCGEISVLLVIVDLLSNGDIEKEKDE